MNTLVSFSLFLNFIHLFNTHIGIFSEVLVGVGGEVFIKSCACKFIELLK